ncbi:UDP-N-acetylmuramoyl-tripeptide--D-alanyl-D-alanine ligase [Photobacterium damselae subsp. damselae]|uniref:UDP-N-acetylmuramoyl-tripeptide--D-alanyl-D- alanine ligase n=1 Tax=Photobacterium damselae TaxID=38293 RepID=UPI000D082567|nr:UDP-N-acetylmuramoyl-tripeptide--D-alanyl-D-alanine ligase [Photobacterium damselae]PSB91113.1 UDP-N-acetylmuramoyl-tripeptide--D-alanyl-D-alanine ligase [Photobacterium damselae subsp. damselae]
MISVSLASLAQAVEGQLIGSDTAISEVSTDTRNIAAQTLFVALKGERFDAHDFCQTAKDNGAVALLVSRHLPVELPQILVKDTRIALGLLGAWLKAQLTQQCGLQTLALTGSCGKTTVKEMCAAILATKGKVLATAGNFNNDIGAPLTLLRLTPEYQYAVIELGANHLGEISYTTNLVKPDVALINNLAAAHLEGFGSLKGVAKAKGEIFEGLAKGATAVINLASNDHELWAPLLADKNVITFSSEEQADFFASDIELDSDGYPHFELHSPQGSVAIHLSQLGLHNVSNALAAAALTSVLGATLAEIKQGLETATNVKGRVAVSQPMVGLRVIDDTYNASVASVKAAIDLLASYQGQRWFILGDMAELGEESENLHREVGLYAQTKGLDKVMTFGKASAVVSELNHGQHFADKQPLIAMVNELLNDQINQQNPLEVTVLVKGARSSRMEEVVAALQEYKQ